MTSEIIKIVECARAAVLRPKGVRPRSQGKIAIDLQGLIPLGKGALMVAKGGIVVYRLAAIVKRERRKARGLGEQGTIHDMTEGASRISSAKLRLVAPLQRRLVNPLDKLAFRLGIPPPGDALLETIGRHTGEPRLTPVCDGLVGDSFWVIAQHGRDSGWVRNLEANPRARVNMGSGWRAGTAHILDDDDPRERQRVLGRANRARRLCLRTSNRLTTDPLTVRIDLAPR